MIDEVTGLEIAIDLNLQEYWICSKETEHAIARADTIKEAKELTMSLGVRATTYIYDVITGEII